MTPVRPGLSGNRSFAPSSSRGEGDQGLSAALLALRSAAGPSLSDPLSRELRSLAAEADPQLAAEGILNLAERLERADSPIEQQLALRLYDLVATSPGPQARPARERLAVWNGSGPFGARAELLLRGFARQASDPALLLGMGVASGLYSLTRTAVLARLLAAPGATWATRGWGARALASAAGFAVEAPGFTLATRLGNEVQGRGPAWNGVEFGREILSSYALLGAMRLSHLGGGALAAGLPGRLSAAWFRQGATLGGIYLGHGLEVALGLRSPRAPGLTLMDSLALLLQFHVAGRFSGEFLGRPFAGLEAALEVRSRLAPEVGGNAGKNGTETGLRFFFPRDAELSLAHAALGTAPRPRPTPEPPARPHAVFMNALSPEGGGAAPDSLLEARLDQLVRPEFSDKAVSPPPRNGKNGRRPIRRLGILTSGGDGPGENAAIEALVRGAIEVHGWQPVGIFDGYRGLLQPEGRVRDLSLGDVRGEAAVRAVLQALYGGRIPAGLAADHADISTLGGDLLRSSRTNPVQGDPEALRVKQTLSEQGIDALVVLGGNGSMRAAEALRRAGVPIVGIPQSIDLDVWGSEHSIGFPSAVAKGAAELHHFQNTAHSCDRWFLVEIMGQHYGMLTLAVGRESRAADSVFIEVPRRLDEVREVIERARPTRAHGVLLFSEGVKFRGEGVSVIEPPRGTDVHGRLVVETGDVVRWLRAPLAEMGITHTRPESLGYLLRGADPTPHEIGLAQTLSLGALRLVESGRFGRMVGTGFVPGSSELRLVYPRLSRVARLQKPAPEEYFRYVRDLLEGPRGAG
ncbi:MAG: 6-phosphofructokinase [bacterium]